MHDPGTVGINEIAASVYQTAFYDLGFCSNGQAECK